MTEQEECKEYLMPLFDAMDILRGKWRLQIIASVSLGKKRFKQISAEIHGITDKMLSKELKELELNNIVKRKVLSNFPPAVEYSITEHGKTLGNLIEELRKWGKIHRENIVSKYR